MKLHIFLNLFSACMLWECACVLASSSQLLLLHAVVLFLFSFCLAGLFVCFAACPRCLVGAAPLLLCSSIPPPPCPLPLWPCQGFCQHCILQGASRNDYTAFRMTWRGSVARRKHTKHWQQPSRYYPSVLCHFKEGSLYGFWDGEWNY